MHSPGKIKLQFRWALREGNNRVGESIDKKGKRIYEYKSQ